MKIRGWLVSGMLLSGLLSACTGMVIEAGVENPAAESTQPPEPMPSDGEQGSGADPELGAPATVIPTPLPPSSDIATYGEPSGHGGDMTGTIRGEVLSVTAQEVHSAENPVVAVIQINPLPYGADDQVLVYGMTEVVRSDGALASWEDIIAGMMISAEGRFGGFHADKIVIEE